MTDLLGADGFLVGLTIAFATAGALAALARSRPALASAAVAATLGTLGGFAAEHRWSWSLVVALALLAFGAELMAGRAIAAQAVAVVPGAVVLAAALPDPVPDWGIAVAAVATAIGATFVVGFDASAPRLAVPLLGLTALGVYGTVPDTEHARALVGGLLGACVLSLWPRVRGRAGAAAAIAGLWAWSTVAGGYPRPASVVGALGCLGVLVLAPLVARPVSRWTATGVGVLALIVLQAGVVVIASRVAGLRSSTAVAIVIVATTWAGAAIVLALAPRAAASYRRRAARPR